MINRKMFSIKSLFQLSFSVKIQFFKTFVMTYFDYCGSLSMYFSKAICTEQLFFIFVFLSHSNSHLVLMNQSWQSFNYSIDSISCRFSAVNFCALLHLYTRSTSPRQLFDTHFLTKWFSQDSGSKVQNFAIFGQLWHVIFPDSAYNRLIDTIL